MKCPKCNSNMLRGKLLGDRYAIKWMNEEDKLFLGLWATRSVKVGSGMGFGRPRANGYRCERCGIIVIDERQAY
ncbi:MAG TPA: PF20097 family protein [Deltaproteobacteria bacterium]|nr:PF20097 family protein [Deltaproteobacteria bacterium]